MSCLLNSFISWCMSSPTHQTSADRLPFESWPRNLMINLLRNLQIRSSSGSNTCSPSSILVYYRTGFLQTKQGRIHPVSNSFRIWKSFSWNAWMNYLHISFPTDSKFFQLTQPSWKRLSSSSDASNRPLKTRKITDKRPTQICQANRKQMKKSKKSKILN